ncbi:hypothetical protein EJB05_57148 [Eragrostis curvula]|uniref:Uncharacterized protein n=1 Tax=Eragrostis curvula TaxID=38414 RepID=A0A5J9SET0_9POAL|nr:hypothetical protein EJB05_57148 [Eragrostis curvula]
MACGQVFSCRMYIDAAALGQEQPCSLSHIVESAVVSHVDGYRFYFRCCLVEFLSGSTSQVGELHPVSDAELLICAKYQMDDWDPGGQRRLGGKPHFKKRGMSGMGSHHVGRRPEVRLLGCLAWTTRRSRHQLKRSSKNYTETSYGSCSSSSSSHFVFLSDSSPSLV